MKEKKSMVHGVEIGTTVNVIVKFTFNARFRTHPGPSNPNGLFPSLISI